MAGKYKQVMPQITMAAPTINLNDLLLSRHCQFTKAMVPMTKKAIAHNPIQINVNPTFATRIILFVPY